MTMSFSSSFEVKVGSESLELGESGNIPPVTTAIGVMFFAGFSTPPAGVKSIQWTIDGREYTVADYITTTTNGQLVMLTDEDLTKPTVKFAWWKPGTYVVEEVLSLDNGETNSLTITCTVTAPSIESVTYSNDGEVKVGTYQNQGTFIRLADRSDFNKDGMYMNFTIAGTQYFKGQIGGFQLASYQRVAQYRNGSFKQLKTNGTYVLDVGQTNTVLFQNLIVPIGTDSTNVDYHTHDGPGQELSVKGGLYVMHIGDDSPQIVPETYEMNVMYKADDEPGSLWVPIQVLKWSWEGKAIFSTGRWNLQDGKVPTPVPSDPTGLPVWSNNTTDQTWVYI